MLQITEQTLKISNRPVLPQGRYGQTIRDIFVALGGVGLGGAIVWTGGHNLLFSERKDDTYPNPSIVDWRGIIHSQTYVRFQVNGKPGENWIMFISFEPSDTFTVRLWRQFAPDVRLETKKMGEVLAEESNVYNDNLQAVVERMYDTEIQARHGGIPI